MDYLERYQKETQWYYRVILLEVYHIHMASKMPGWTVTKTAGYFKISISLVSENLSLAEAIHQHPELMNCESRSKALKQMEQINGVS